MRRLLIGVLLALSLSLSLAPTASADDEMGIERAGKYYLKIECAAQAGIDHFNAVFLHGQNVIRYPEIKRRLPELRRLTADLSRALYKLARQEYNPPAPWPSNVVRLTNREANLTTRQSNLFARASDARSAAEYLRLFKQANRVPFGSVVTHILALLNVKHANC